MAVPRRRVHGSYCGTDPGRAWANGAKLDVVEPVSQHQFHCRGERLDNHLATRTRHRSIFQVEVGVNLNQTVASLVLERAGCLAVEVGSSGG